MGKIKHNHTDINRIMSTLINANNILDNTI